MKELEERMLEYRSIPDIKLDKNLPVLVMIDGRGFSKHIKNKFKKPFDEEFIRIMNSVAEKVSKEVMSVRFAYVQSDEISFYLDSRRDDGNNPEAFFDLRLCKLNSIIASIASGEFNKQRLILECKNVEDIKDFCPIQFDCKAWNVPEDNDVFAWFLYRQLDCIKNSKQQAAQTYLPHKVLLGKTADEMIKLLEKEKGISWKEDYNDGEKYGRFIWKEYEQFHNDKMDVDYLRSIWRSHYAWKLTEEEGKERFLELIKKSKEGN